MDLDRKINLETIDLAILKRGWGFLEAAARIGIDRKTLSKVYKTRKAQNKVILKISKSLDIPLEQLVVWPTNGHDLSAR